jgi:iron(III) transport system substrate-binding protein
MKGTKNKEAAQKLLDWTVTQKANEFYGKYYAIVAHPAIKAAPPNYPANAEAAMVKNDIDWMASNRDKILAEWTKRYDSKSAPK